MSLPVVATPNGLAHRRVVLAITLAIMATLAGSLVPIAAHHAPRSMSGLVSAAMLVFEIGAYTASLMLVIARLRAASRAPLGRGSSHL